MSIWDKSLLKLLSTSSTKYLRARSVAIWRPQIQFRIRWFGVILPAQPQKFDVPLTARRTSELHAKRTLKVGNFTVWSFRTEGLGVSSIWRFKFQISVSVSFWSLEIAHARSLIKPQTRTKLERNASFSAGLSVYI